MKLHPMTLGEEFRQYMPPPLHEEKVQFLTVGEELLRCIPSARLTVNPCITAAAVSPLWR
jgi:hypothetical protein